MDQRQSLRVAPDLGPARALTIALVATLVGAGCGGNVVLESEGAGGAATVTGGDLGGGGAGATNSTAASSGGSCLDALPGRYAMALAVQLGPSTPIVLLADVAADGDRLVIQVTPLATPYRDDVDTEALRPLAPVGEAITFTTSPLGPDGTFTFEGGDVRVPGAANPFSSNEIVAKLSFSGSSCGSAAPFCGTVSGQVTQPLVIELSESANTFALNTELGGTGIPYTIDCNGTLSNPIP